jgi:hypothetical protein
MSVTCRNKHQFTTRARPGSTISCPRCRLDGHRVAVWVPVRRTQPDDDHQDHADTAPADTTTGPRLSRLEVMAGRLDDRLDEINGRLDQLARRPRDQASGAVPAVVDGYPPARDLARWLSDILDRLDQLETLLADQELEQESADWAATWEAEQAERHLRNAVTWHAALWEAHGSTPVDSFEAARIWNLSLGKGRDRLGHITTRGLATRTPKGPGQTRDLYTMHAPEEENANAAAVEVE